MERKILPSSILHSIYKLTPHEVKYIYPYDLARFIQVSLYQLSESIYMKAELWEQAQTIYMKAELWEQVQSKHTIKYEYNWELVEESTNPQELIEGYVNNNTVYMVNKGIEIDPNPN